METESSSGKPGFSLFSIDEHRLSLGLLVMVLLAGTGYGLWMAVSPLLPGSIAATAPESRIQIGEAHFGDEDWTSAISVYNEILEDDPDNGYAILKVSDARNRQLSAKWNELTKLKEDSTETEVSEELLADESRLFELAIRSCRQLLDNARYRRRAYERVASLHSLRSQILDDPQELDKAIAVLKEMFENGYTTRRTIRDTRALRPLRSYKRFSNLVLEEQRVSNLRN